MHRLREKAQIVGNQSATCFGQFLTLIKELQRYSVKCMKIS